MREARSVPLVVEIGCEEIPARFLDEATREFGARVERALRAARLLVGEGEQEDNVAASTSAVQAYSTPRRLVVFAPSLLPVQPNQVEEITGPPVRVAFDAAGKPTRAAESFAEKNQVPVHSLIRKTTPKGEYLAVRRTVAGRPALELLGEIIPLATLGLAWPKAMVWAGKQSFVRPIRWILALLGEGKSARVVPFEIAGVQSGNRTLGHRSYSRRPISVTGFKDYLKKLAKARVEIDPEARRDRIKSQVEVLLENLSLNAVEDRELEDWTVNSTEWPHPILGGFDPRFLALPREILVAVMRGHQKYFAVEDLEGKLQPRFVAVVNLDSDPSGFIRSGHERVLTARFSDAEFFWNADQKIPLRERLPILERVTYQEKLGSYADKVRRMEAMAREICRTLEEQGRLTPADTKHALRAVQLCKCDLTTQMVQEFPELQGVVGGLYASGQNEPREVADAIYDHYRPQSAEDSCPRSMVGAVVALSDKFDSVVAGFSAGLAPTSSSDPFGLRRAGNGVVRITVELGLPISLKDLAVKYLETVSVPKSAILAVVEFFDDRLRYYLESVRRVRYDTVRAIPKAHWLTPLSVLKCAEVLEKARDGEDLQAMAAAARRIRNLLTKSATSADWSQGVVDEGALLDEAERDLFRAYQKTENDIAIALASDNYAGALKLLAAMRPQVDRFFDKVLVMHEDKLLRENRLRLLAKLDALFTSIADLSQIESKALDSVGASTS